MLLAPIFSRLGCRLRFRLGRRRQRTLLLGIRPRALLGGHALGVVSEGTFSHWACMPRWRYSHHCCQRGLAPCLEHNEVFAAVASVLTSMAFIGERVLL